MHNFQTTSLSALKMKVTNDSEFTFMVSEGAEKLISFLDHLSTKEAQTRFAKEVLEGFRAGKQ